ncbi:hypothetical protein Avbf_17648 [Armadillidium vulgare]|nr:hypothetical protein Avbf_17648 [Armadillidium vulgare]
MFLKTKQSILFIDAHLTIKELFTANLERFSTEQF